jgi:uncharacterized alpha-E superfamily protein
VKRLISSRELRDIEPPSARGGTFDREPTLQLLDVAADTIESLEAQIVELQRTVAIARTESAPMEITNYADDPDDVFTEWLANLDPIQLDRQVQASIAQAMVEATLAARQIRAEGQERIKALVDAVTAETEALVHIVTNSRGSLEAMHRLPEDLATWQGHFGARIGALMEQLQLPWTAQVSQLARLLSHLAAAEAPKTA